MQKLSIVKMDAESPRGSYPVLELEYWVKDRARGVFMVGGAPGEPVHIGIAENDLKEAIRQACCSGVKWFRFAYTIGMNRTYFLACAWTIAEVRAHMRRDLIEGDSGMLYCDVKGGE